MIPKVIHYCWFGGNPIPETLEKCIESWKRFCPDYEIRRWDESNYDVNACDYTKEAYAEGKWAFVSDYARFDILYRHGGIYLDTDVEIIRPIDDILKQGAWFGEEQSETGSILVAPGLGMAAEAGHPFYKRMLEQYARMHFLNPDGTHNRTTVVKYTTDLLREYGLKEETGVQCVEGIRIYPWDYFCPMEYRTGVITITSNTRTIHHYSASWLGKEEKTAHLVAQKAARLFGRKIGKRIGRIYSLPYRTKKKIKEVGIRRTAEMAVRKILKRKHTC